MHARYPLRAMFLGVTCFAGLALFATSPGASRGPVGVHPASTHAADAVPADLSPGERRAMRGLLQLQTGVGNDSPVMCFARGTSTEYMNRVMELYPHSTSVNPTEDGADPRYQLNGRWPGAQGDPIVLTWSLVPDGLNVDGQGSTLFATLDSQFGGNRALWIQRITEAFNRWAEMTGTSYVRLTAAGVDWDDGGSWTTTDGNGTTRGDIRIGMIAQDGVNGVLAYNYYPTAGTRKGDMVLDSAENWADATNNHRFMRNIIQHEHGHGLGFFHSCPLAGTKLMEPNLILGVDGLRHDDLRAGHRFYGDIHEPDNTAATGFNLGTLTSGVPLTTTCTPPPPVSGTNGTLVWTCSIDADGEQDYYKFTVTSPGTASVSVIPKGMTYDTSPQSCSGQPASCCSGNNVNSLAVADLNVQLIGTNGVTVLATGASQPAGSTETLSNVTLTGAPGTFYIRVYEGDTPTQSQIYDMTVSYTSTLIDCNGNAVADATDIANGTSLDCNLNTIPDECEFPGCPGIMLADMNCDGRINGADIPRLVKVMVAGGYTCQADMDQNGSVSVLVDAPLFADALVTAP